jgi:hypothetical protein
MEKEFEKCGKYKLTGHTVEKAYGTDRMISKHTIQRAL